MKVLVPTDGSRGANAAIATALRLLSPLERDLDLLCVAHPIDRHRKKAGAIEPSAFSVLSQATHVLRHTRNMLKTEHGLVNSIMQIGAPAVLIIDRTADYDLTVLGAYGDRVQDSGGIGTVTSRVIEHAKGPVLVARPLARIANIKVLIAADGSAASMTAIEVFCRLFHLIDSEACLLHVLDPPWARETQDVAEELLKESAAIMHQACSRLETVYAVVEKRTDEGNPAEAILREAQRGYDLIVLGGTGVRDCRCLILGSVAARVVMNAQCSVLVGRELPSV